MQDPTTEKLTRFNALTLVGLIGLIFWIILWNGWLTSEQTVPRSIEILLLVAPQLIFLYGVLYRRFNAHVYVSLTSLVYFMLGAWYVLSPIEWLYGGLMIVLSLLQFTGGFYFARTIMLRDKAEKATIEKGAT